MKTKIIIVVMLIGLAGCSEKKPMPVEKKHLDIAKVEVKKTEEFIPEHIRKSKIEVVKRN